jgi:hypothetical protein
MATVVMNVENSREVWRQYNYEPHLHFHVTLKILRLHDKDKPVYTVYDNSYILF